MFWWFLIKYKFFTVGIAYIFFWLTFHSKGSSRYHKWRTSLNVLSVFLWPLTSFWWENHMCYLEWRWLSAEFTGLRGLCSCYQLCAVRFGPPWVFCIFCTIYSVQALLQLIWTGSVCLTAKMMQSDCWVYEDIAADKKACLKEGSLNSHGKSKAVSFCLQWLMCISRTWLEVQEPVGSKQLPKMKSQKCNPMLWVSFQFLIWISAFLFWRKFCRYKGRGVVSSGSV